MISLQAPMASTYLAGSATCEPTWNESPRTRTPRLAREFEQRRHGGRLAAELARQIDDRGRVAERHAQQQLGAPPMALELADLVRVVGDERVDAETQRRADIRVGLDRVRVDAALGADARRLDQLISPVVATSKYAPRSRSSATTAACGKGFSA